MKLMTRFEYWRHGLKSGWYKDSYWVKSCLSVFETTAKEEYLLKRDEKGFYCFDNGEEIRISDVKDTTKPLLKVGEMLDIPDGELPNHKGNIRTSVGCLLQNYVMTIGPFKHKVPYINKPFKASDVEKYFYKWKKSLSNLKEGEEPNPDEIYTEEFLEFAENVLHLTDYSQTLVASITEKALRKNPLLEKRKKELYEEHKHELDDPVIIAKIDKELAKIDKDWMQGDEATGFLISGKQYTNVRKRLNTHFGMAKGLDNDDVFVGKSLRDGIDINRLSDYVNDYYVGSIGRGLETQEGGVEVKNAIRSAANLKVDGEDCGSTKGQMITLHDSVEKNLKYLGYSFIENKKTIKITEEMLPKLSGKTLEMRSPSYCVAKKNTYCKTCVGPFAAEYPNGIVSLNASIGSSILSVSMSSTHSVITATTKWKTSLIQ